jgi:WD40 repeat protein
MNEIIERTMLTRTQEPTRRENRPFSRNSGQNEATTVKDDAGKTNESPILTRTQESNEKSAAAQRKEEKPIEIDGRDYIYSVAFLVDGKHVVSGGEEGKIRRWRVEDGEEVGMPMDAGSGVFSIAVSRDGKWIVSGTKVAW